MKKKSKTKDNIQKDGLIQGCKNWQVKTHQEQNISDGNDGRSRAITRRDKGTRT